MGEGPVNLGANSRVTPAGLRGVEAHEDVHAIQEPEPDPMGSRRRESAISEEEFSTFFSSNIDRSHRLAWRLLGGDDTAAEDVVQDAFVRAFRSLSSFRGDSSIDTWFYRILVRTAQNQNRWQWLRLRRNAGEIDPEDQPDADRGDDTLLKRRLNRAVARLGRNQRDAFVLVHLEGFTVNDTATLLGKAEGTIKSHLHRALTKLRAELGDIARGETDHGREERALHASAGRRAR